MKIIDIMRDVSLVLGLSSISSDIEGIDLDSEDVILTDDVQTLFNLTRVAIQEFCTNYAPVTDVAQIVVTGGKFPVSDINNFLRLKRVTQNGKEVKSKIINRQINVNLDGTYEVEYYTYPNITSVNDDIDFLNNFTPDVLVSSTCAYWAVSHGQYVEFNRFHEEYVNKASAIKELRVFSLPKRRWE